MNGRIQWLHLTELYTAANYLQVKEKVMEPKYGPISPSMRVTGKMTKQMDVEDLYMQMGMFMKEAGGKIVPMEKVDEFVNFMFWIICKST